MLFGLQRKSRLDRESRDRNILDSDRNTTYFHVVANQRSRKKRVDVLEDVNVQLVTNQKGVIDIVVGFYKNLFAKEDRPNIKLADDFQSPDDFVSIEENELLTRLFSEEEIKTVVFSCYADGAPGLDGISFMFYQRYWEVIKKDLVSMFNDFWNGDLDLYRLNFAMINLIPKEEGATSMMKFRPISLIKLQFKYLF